LLATLALRYTLSLLAEGELDVFEDILDFDIVALMDALAVIANLKDPSPPLQQGVLPHQANEFQPIGDCFLAVLLELDDPLVDRLHYLQHELLDLLLDDGLSQDSRSVLLYDPVKLVLELIVLNSLPVVLSCLITLLIALIMILFAAIIGFGLGYGPSPV